MRLRTAVTLALLLIAAAADTAHAQYLPPVVVRRSSPTAAGVGDTIRLSMSDNTRLTGVLSGLDARSLSLTDFRGARHTFPTSQIGLFEVQKMRPVGQRIAMGAGIGALAGLVVPYLASAIRGTHTTCDRSGYCRRSYDDVGDQATAGMLAGALIGGSIGIAVPWHDWRLVRLEFGRR